MEDTRGTGGQPWPPDRAQQAQSPATNSALPQQPGTANSQNWQQQQQQGSSIVSDNIATGAVNTVSGNNNYPAGSDSATVVLTDRLGDSDEGKRFDFLTPQRVNDFDLPSKNDDIFGDLGNEDPFGPL